MNQQLRELIDARITELKIRLAHARRNYLKNPDRKSIVQLDAQISALEWVLRESEAYECVCR